VALFLPVFGHFALSMSLLAGLGLLRVVWMPIIDNYPALLRFGDVAFVPYLVSVYLPALAGFDIRVALVYGILGAGILLFTAGTFTSSTLFLLPLPRLVSRIVSAPMRWSLRKNWPTAGRDVVVVFAVYTGVTILMSMPFVLLDWPPRVQAMLHAFPYNLPPFR